MDWMRHLRLPKFRLLGWSLLHFPFHMALVLFMEGASQYTVLWKIAQLMDEVVVAIYGKLSDLIADNAANSNSSTNIMNSDSVDQFIRGINETIWSEFRQY